jgi:hypothetical protein
MYVNTWVYDLKTFLSCFEVRTNIFFIS